MGRRRDLHVFPVEGDFDRVQVLKTLDGEHPVMAYARARRDGEVPAVSRDDFFSAACEQMIRLVYADITYHRDSLANFLRAETHHPAFG